MNLASPTLKDIEKFTVDFLEEILNEQYRQNQLNQKGQNMTKTFYVFSGMLPDSMPMGSLTKFETEKDAIEAAKSIIKKRREQGKPEIGFYILKAELYVAPVETPIVVKKLRGKK